MIEMRVWPRVVACVEMEKDLCLHLVQPFLENINRGCRNYGSRRLIPVLGDSHKKDPSSPVTTALTFKYLAIVSP